MADRQEGRGRPARIPYQALIKLPRQARAEATVTAILNATVRLLNEGSGEFTTNHVAHDAGVSPGTLYQYFANKEALIAGVLERGVMDIEDTLRSVPVHVDVPLEEVLSTTLTVMITGLSPFGKLLNAVLSTSPMLARNGILTLLEPRLTAAIHLVLLQRQGVTVHGGGAAFFVAVNSAIVTVLRWLAERPPWLSLDELVAALTRQCMVHIEETPREATPGAQSSPM